MFECLGSEIVCDDYIILLLWHIYLCICGVEVYYSVHSKFEQLFSVSL